MLCFGMPPVLRPHCYIASFFVTKGGVSKSVVTPVCRRLIMSSIICPNTRLSVLIERKANAQESERISAKRTHYTLNGELRRATDLLHHHGVSVFRLAFPQTVHGRRLYRSSQLLLHNLYAPHLRTDNQCQTMGGTADRVLGSRPVHRGLGTVRRRLLLHSSKGRPQITKSKNFNSFMIQSSYRLGLRHGNQTALGSLGPALTLRHFSAISQTGYGADTCWLD